MKTRLALIHATRVAIDPIEAAAKALWPDVETVSILEEGLSEDRRKSEELSQNLWDRIVALSQYAESIDSQGILFTCSAFGQAIDDAARKSKVPVMKPNEAMFDNAFAHGERVAMIYTFPPAAPGMEVEFREAAAARGSDAQIASVFCDGAMDAKRAGDTETHDRLIAETAAGIENADVILLAQFSMASAAETIRAGSRLPVLTSPEAAITEMQRRIGGSGA